MKQLKTKLIVTVAMLLIATVMMSTASYAWFTLSTKPEIDGLKTTVVVNQNLEIAYKNDSTAPDTSKVGDSGKADTYGNLISTTDTTGQSATVDGTVNIGKGNFSVDYKTIEKTLRPIVLGNGEKTGSNVITTDGKDLAKDNSNLAEKGVFYFPVYGTNLDDGDGEDGRVVRLEKCIELAIPGAVSGEKTGFGYIIIPDEKLDKNGEGTGEYYAAGDDGVKITITGSSGSYSTSVAHGKVAGYYVENWVRSNITGYLAISAASSTVRSSGAANYTAQTGDGSYFVADTTGNMTLKQQEELAKNIRVAFKFGDESKYAGYTALNIAGDVENNAKPSDADADYKDRKGTYRLKDGTASNATILGEFKDETTDATDLNKTESDIKQVHVNSDCVLRLYFYLDGREVTNELASTQIHSSQTTAVEIKGEWNLQFKIVEAKDGGGYKDLEKNYSMDDTNVK